MKGAAFPLLESLVSCVSFLETVDITLVVFGVVPNSSSVAFSALAVATLLCNLFPLSRAAAKTLPSFALNISTLVVVRPDFRLRYIDFRPLRYSFHPLYG